jgi:PAS domain S-box-containing protein
MYQSASVDGTLAALIKFSPIASVVTNPRLHDNPIISCNRAFVELTGYPEDEILGRNCRFLAGPDTEPWLTEAITRGISGHKPVLVDILNYKRDGTPFRNAVLVAPVYDDNGDLEYFLGSQVELDDNAPGPSNPRRRAANKLIGTLSPRQLDVLKQVASGHLNKQIAYNLNLSEKTVKMHRALLMKKLGVPTAADAVRLAIEAGI